MAKMTKAQVYSAVGVPTKSTQKVDYKSVGDDHVLPRTVDEWLTGIGLVALVLIACVLVMF